MSDRAKKYLQILVLALSGGSIYLIPYIRYVFYDFQIEAMAISNQEIGLLSSAYAIGCMLTYIPGGVISDKFSTKRNIFISLISTTLVTLLFAFNMKNYTLSLICFFLFALTTSFLFWTSLMKTIRLVSGDDEQGRMYGVYYAGNGITGGVINSIALWATKFGQTTDDKFFIAVICYAISTGIAALLVWLFLEDRSGQKDISNPDEQFQFRHVGQLLKSPVVWIFSLVIFSGYAVYSSTSYFTPYLTDVIGVSAEESGFMTILRTYFMMLLAPLGGFLADKVFKSTSRWFMVAFALLGILMVSVLMIPSSVNPSIVSVYTLLPGAVGLALYGVLFSITSEAKIPAYMSGTAIGIASIIGYTPDFFMATMFGSWLDNMGSDGYTMIFMFLTAVCAVGLLGALYIRRRMLKLEKEEEAVKIAENNA